MFTALPKTIRSLLIGMLLLCVLGASVFIPPREVNAAEPVSLTVVATMISIVAVKNLITLLKEKCPKLNFNESCQNELHKNGKKIVDDAARKQKIQRISPDQVVVLYSIILHKLSKASTLLQERPVSLPQLYALFTPLLGKPVIQKIERVEKKIKEGSLCKNETCVRKAAQEIKKITRFQKEELFAVCSSYLMGTLKYYFQYCTNLEKSFFENFIQDKPFNPKKTSEIRQSQEPPPKKKQFEKIGESNRRQNGEYEVVYEDRGVVCWREIKNFIHPSVSFSEEEVEKLKKLIVKICQKYREIYKIVRQITGQVTNGWRNWDSIEKGKMYIAFATKLYPDYAGHMSSDGTTMFISIEKVLGIGSDVDKGTDKNLFSELLPIVIVTHELGHALNRGVQFDSKYKEGMSEWLANEVLRRLYPQETQKNYLGYMRYSKKTIRNVQQKVQSKQFHIRSMEPSTIEHYAYLFYFIHYLNLRAEEKNSSVQVLQKMHTLLAPAEVLYPKQFSDKEMETILRDVFGDNMTLEKFAQDYHAWLLKMKI